MNANLQDLDTIINWKPFTFDGINTPSTGVLCKWYWGEIDYYDPRKHKDLCSGIRFVEDDESFESRQTKESKECPKDNDTYIDDLGGLVSTFSF